jgi:hypothetical protein
VKEGLALRRAGSAGGRKLADFDSDEDAAERALVEKDCCRERDRVTKPGLSIMTIWRIAS